MELYSEEWFKTVQYAVEATNYEHLCLWQRWNEKVTWVDCLQGILHTVGTNEDRPVCIALRSSTINNKVVMFYEATSQLVDYKMIEQFLKDKCPSAKTTDSMNFHLVP